MKNYQKMTAKIGRYLLTHKEASKTLLQPSRDSVLIGYKHYVLADIGLVLPGPTVTLRFVSIPLSF